MNNPILRASLCAALVCASLQAAGAADASATRQQVLGQYANLPMRFEPNVGQSDAAVRFLARGNGYTLFLTQSESVIVLGKPASAAQADVVRMRLAGANAASRVEGLEPLPGITNYFLGNDPAQWRTDIVSFAKVRYSEVYAGIDLVYYGSGRDIEYDFVVRPGSDPAAIRLTFAGARGPDCDELEIR